MLCFFEGRYLLTCALNITLFTATFMTLEFSSNLTELILNIPFCISECFYYVSLCSASFKHMDKQTCSCNVSKDVNPYLIRYSIYLISLIQTNEVAYLSGIKFCKTAPGYRVRKCIHYYTTANTPNTLPPYALCCLCHELSACPHT